MKKLIFTITVLICLGSLAFADEWEDLIRQALRQMPSARKRHTASGRRLLKEKMARIKEIDSEAPVLFRHQDYERLEQVLKEALRLTIEYYGANDTHVAEKFISLGIVYMQTELYGKAESAFQWALRIAEPTLGQGSWQLSNIYKFLAAAYYEQGKYDSAKDAAEELLAINVYEFGPRSQQAEEARKFLKKMYR